MNRPDCTCAEEAGTRLRLWNARAHPTVLRLVKRGRLDVRRLRYVHKLIVAMDKCAGIAFDPRKGHHSHHAKDCPRGQWMRANYTVELTDAVR